MRLTIKYNSIFATAKSACSTRDFIRSCASDRLPLLGQSAGFATLRGVLHPRTPG